MIRMCTGAWRAITKKVGKGAEAKAEFDKTRSLQKAADESVFTKLEEAQAKGQPADKAQSVPAEN